jgi:prephenate dehydratase
MARSASPAPPIVAFLGPVGTFTEQALFTQPDLARADLRPIASIPEVLHSVADGDATLGFVPIENAIEGTVNLTLDTLAFDLDLLIRREVVIDINLNLVAPRGVGLGDIKRIVSIPVATAQCWKYLHDHLPGVRVDAANSTAEAAELVATEHDGNTAAIAPARSAELYGLDIVAAEIEDHPENKTRFVAVARDGVPQPTGHDKTSIVVFQRANVPGSLLTILQEFAARSINLSKLESRPTKVSLGDYCFIIDLDGHIADELVADALRTIHAKQAHVKFLGSYPAAGDHGEAVREEVQLSWQRADEWIAGLRGQIS